MMANQQQHPITPPDGLMQQWRSQAPRVRDAGATREQWIATQAARWGADQELEACCAHNRWIYDQHRADWLRAARRPKPTNLKKQALTELNLTADPEGAELSRTQVELIRRALESLPD